jgi:hypothetical protein
LARRAPRGEEPRTKTLTVRLTATERALVEQRAAAANLTPSGYLGALIRTGRVTVQRTDTLDPTRKAELTRIAHSVVALADAARAGQAPGQWQTVEAMHDLMTWLMQDEITRRRVEAYEARRGADDTEAAPARDEFQRRVNLSPAR